ncbi:MAG TPA: efflux RND transporter periplasmic adaptor subunit [Candidatus Deferrimicrobium sp.]|nr:efflux RND transporter periplasmic adaptor subunit [Candidatus Deferrimicrobium sp.]
MRFGWFLVVCVIVSAGYFYARPDLRALPIWLGAEEEVAVHVTVVRKVAGPITIRLKGELAPVKAVDIVSPFAGRVVEVRFKAGDAVRAGAILATIHAGALEQRITELEAAVAVAEQDLKTNEERLADAEKQMARQDELLRQDLIPRRDLEEAQVRAKNARAQREFQRAQLIQQQAMLAQARALRARTRLTAPFSGVVSRRLAEPGAAIAESGAILTIVDVDSLKLAASFVGTHFADIRAGMPVEISSRAAPGQTLAGTVVRVYPPAGDGLENAQVEIHAGVTQRNFRPGMAVEAVIVLAKRQEALWVPRSAVMAMQGKNYVYRLAGGRALRQEIALGAVRNGDVEVTQGIDDGDAVIIDQLNLLKPGIRVQPQ